MKSSTFLRLPLITVITLLAANSIPTVAPAAVVTLTASDAAGSTSFNTAGHWSNLAAPNAANDYYTAGQALRTPADANSYVFAGGSLTLSNQNSTGFGSLLDKFSAGAGGVRTLTINNFTNQIGGELRSGGTAGAFVHIQGNHFTIAGNSCVYADQCIWVIDSPLLGTDGVILTNSSANGASDHVSFTGTNSGFTGSFYLTVSNGSGWSAEMDSVYSPPGNPSTFNPGQISFIGGPNHSGGILVDMAGCSFTNSNGGFSLLTNGTINAVATTLIGEPITDFTNGVSSVSSLTSGGAGTLILSNANNNYSGGTVISGGVLQLGVANSVPVGLVTDNATFDLDTFSDAIDGLTGTGTVETTGGGTPTLTIGTAGGSATFSGIIQENSGGTLSVIKTGAGTEAFSAGYGYKGTTTVAGGTLSLITTGVLPGTPGDTIVSNGAALTVNASGGAALPVQNLLLATNSTLNLSVNGTASGISATAGLTFQDNATNTLIYGNLTANPTAPAITAAGAISAPGTNIVINISALGLKAGTFTLIKYTGTPLASIANFMLVPPPGVNATLVNNTGNDSIDINITSTPNQLAWNGVAGNNWDLSTANWTNILAGGITVFQQYTNNGVVAGDSVLFDDTLTNTSPEPTNVNVTGGFYCFPLVENSSLPYSLSGPGGILGPTSLVKSNSGTWTVLTSNSYTGGTFVYGGTLVISNDNTLGANNGAVQLNGGNLQYLGSSTNNVRPFSFPSTGYIAVSTNNTVQLGGAITGAGALQKQDLGTLVLAGKATLTGATTGNLLENLGVLTIPAGGSVSNAYFDDIGQDASDNATLNITGGSLTTASDFNIGNDGSSVGTVNISSGTLTANAIFVGSGFSGGSTASGTVNQSGGTVTELSSVAGEFAIGGRTSTSAVGVYNLTGGTLTANAAIRVGGTGIGTLNQSGSSTINAVQGINIARIAGSFGTNNLNGGTLNAFNVTSTTGSNAVFNFNGGILKAAFTNASPFMSGLSQANILAGGAIIDDGGGTALITQPLLAGSPAGGLSKQGSGTLTLTGVNTFTGPITNNAGTLFLNSASTYSGAVQINAGTVAISTSSQLQGSINVSTNGTLAVVQAGGATATVGNVTFNGGKLPGSTLALALTSANNASVPVVNAGTVTLTGTNTISLAGMLNVGPIALVKYAGALGGTGNITNLTLPQGAAGSISNDVIDSILYAVITSAGSGIIWTGTNSAAALTNLWDINSTTNWSVNSTATRYQQLLSAIPGDSVTFNDSGSGTVILNTNVSPSSVTISNNAKTYTFSGRGTISGATGLSEVGTGTAIINLTNNSYTGNTTISNGTLQVGNSAAVSPNANVVVGTGGTIELNGFSQTTGDLIGSGVVDNASGNNLTLTVGSRSGGTWNGTIQDHTGSTIALIKRGSGTWVIGGTNNLDNGASFQVENQFNGGTTVITNGGLVSMPFLEMYVGNGAGTASSVVVAGGTLSLSNTLTLGTNGGTGTLVVNSGTVSHQGNPNNVFTYANNIVVGGLGSSTGTLIVNGGQVLNSQAVTVGQGAGSTGTFILNGGLVQATIVFTGTGANGTNSFNGGTLQAVTNSGDFIQTASMVMSNGLVLDDGGHAVSIVTAALVAGDAFNGGLVKEGSGTVYLDNAGNTYTGATLVTNGALAGVGTIAGPVVVAPAGNLGAGDAGALAGGILTINNNLTLQGTATFRVSVTGNSPANDQITGVATANYGGTLVISNVTSDTTVLTNGQTFQLFNAAGHSGNFATIVGSPGAGLSYVFNTATGVLSVTNVIVKSVPRFTHISVSGTTLTISGTNGTASSPYVLLGSTNVAMPVAQWTPLLTNSFDSSGNFSLSTNILNPGVPLEFYLLSQ